MSSLEDFEEPERTPAAGPPALKARVYSDPTGSGLDLGDSGSDFASSD